MSTPMRPVPDRKLTSREHFGSPAVWFAFLGGPLAWVAHFLSIYASVSLACDAGADYMLYLTTVVAAPVAIFAGVVSWRLWHRPESELDEVDARFLRRTRFIGRSGFLMSAIFLLAILMEGASPLFLDPCGSGV